MNVSNLKISTGRPVLRIIGSGKKGPRNTGSGNTGLGKVLPLAIAMALTACGSSDTSTSTSSTPGYTSVGIITGFGSIFVNGVEFETDTAIFDVDGIPGTQDDLSVGMKVGVVGSINADGVTGIATGVDFDEELQGPVSGIDVGDGLTRLFTVLGTSVVIDSNSTNFDDDSGTFSFDTIEDNDNVEISGFFDDTGVLHATRVELEDEDFDSSSMVEVEGVISGLSGTSFSIETRNKGSLDVDASAAELDDLPDGLVNGLQVEVKGTFDTIANILLATKVEGEDNDLGDSDSEVEIEGIITRYESDTDFDVDDHAVDASSAEREPATLVLAPGLHVEVEGKVENGVLIAHEVKTREDTNAVAALVNSVDIDAGTFTLEPVAGQDLITVRVTTTTEIEHEDSGDDRFSLANFQIGDFVSVEGYINGDGELEAMSSHTMDATGEDVYVRSLITAFDRDSVITTVTVLGVNFPYDDTTSFERDDLVTYTADDFFNEVSVKEGTAKISVKDMDVDGIADVIELDNDLD